VDEVQMVQGRRIGPLELAQIQGLIAAHPDWSRWRLSRVLAEQWQWYAPSGQLKDMAARTLLLKLHRRQCIRLPEARHAPRPRRPLRDPASGPGFEFTPVVGPLEGLRPLQIQVVGRREAGYARFQQYLAQHHYLGYRGPVGENLAYWVASRQGTDLACVLFGAAAWQCAPRDRWIGWSPAQRRRGLSGLANQSRFLLLPWVRVPGLATHLLSQIAARISGDWQRRYGHPLYLLESFVQRDRFRGTSYQGANWIHVGQTTGRTRQGSHYGPRAPRKDIYLYPLTGDVSRQLCG